MAVFVTGAGKLSSVFPVFSMNSWEQIIKACQSGEVPDTWNVGDQKVMTIDGNDYLIDIIGKNHDNYSDGTGKAPLTFQLHDHYATRYMIHADKEAVGSWTSCDMRTAHLPSILSLMPTEVQGNMREVNKLSSQGDGSTTIKTTADKLFLLSEIEVFGTVALSVSGEGSQYAYYAAGNSKIKNSYGGGAFPWWLRSPITRATPSNYASFCRVYTAGYAESCIVEWKGGVAFAFCF